MKAVTFLFILSFVHFFNASAISESAISESFFHHGKSRDRVVFYLDKPVRIVRQNKILSNDLHRLLIKFIGAFPVEKYVLDHINLEKSSDYDVRCREVNHNVLCTVSYNPRRIGVMIAQFKGIHQEPTVGITISRKNYKIKKNKVPLIVIDPGHGGEKFGACGIGGIKEKHIVLSIAHLLRKCLQEKGFRVYMTRSNDRFLQLDVRTSRANKLNADLLISLHSNYAFDSKVRGLETFYGGDKSKTIASLVHNNLLNQKFNGESLRDRRIKLASSQMLYGTEAPALLIELLFLSNSQDVKIISSRSNQVLVARRLCDAISDHFRVCSR